MDHSQRVHFDVKSNLENNLPFSSIHIIFKKFIDPKSRLDFYFRETTQVLISFVFAVPIFCLAKILQVLAVE